MGVSGQEKIYLKLVRNAIEPVCDILSGAFDAADAGTA